MLTKEQKRIERSRTAPKTIANMFATGHAEAYEPGIEAFGERLG